MRIRLPKRFKISVPAALGYALISTIGRTMRLRIVNGEGVESRRRNGDGQLLVTWHGRTMVPLYYFRRKSVLTMISPSRDGEIQDRVYRRFGWLTIRGSSRRGAAKATLASVRALRDGATMALAPDGPMGPSRVVQPGALYLARKSGHPVVPAGVSAAPAWTLSSWDRFLLPKPFARAVIVFGEPMHVAADASDAELQALAVSLGETIDDLERRADELVGNKDMAVARL